MPANPLFSTPEVEIDHESDCGSLSSSPREPKTPTSNNSTPSSPSSAKSLSKSLSTLETLISSDRLKPRHPSVFAPSCGHQLHASASSKTRLCNDCVVFAVQEAHDLIRYQFDILGGLDVPRADRDWTWNTARLTCIQAIKSFIRIQRRNLAREAKERLWDEVHQAWEEKTDVRLLNLKNSAVVRTIWDTGCGACAAFVQQQGLSGKELPEEDLGMETTEKADAWWEKPSPQPQTRDQSSKKNTRTLPHRYPVNFVPLPSHKPETNTAVSILRPIIAICRYEMVHAAARKAELQRRATLLKGREDLQKDKAARAAYFTRLVAIFRVKYDISPGQKYRRPERMFSNPYPAGRALTWFEWKRGQKLKRRSNNRIQAWKSKPSPLRKMQVVEEDMAKGARGRKEVQQMQKGNKEAKEVEDGKKGKKGKGYKAFKGKKHKKGKQAKIAKKEVKAEKGVETKEVVGGAAENPWHFIDLMYIVG